MAARTEYLSVLVQRRLTCHTRMNRKIHCRSIALTSDRSVRIRMLLLPKLIEWQRVVIPLVEIGRLPP
jgi:hypothetical protein